MQIAGVSSQDLLNALNSYGCHNYMSYYLSRTKKATETRPEDIMNSYNYIGVAGDMYDESVVLLAHILRRPLGDVLYLPSKVADGISPTANITRVRHKALSEEPYDVQDYAKSDHFRERNLMDYDLLSRASSFIRIHYRSYPTLNISLSHFKTLIEKAQDTCEGYIEKDASMKDEKCFLKDSGCGYECLSRLWKHHLLADKTRD